jgi:mono/diheme cytochrome c family protein/glucose/arabinose dehydrogenase
MKALSRPVWLALGAAAAVYLASFSLVAQSQTPMPQGSGQPTQASPQGATPPPAGQALDAGRGRQGGRGGRGGPNETDPANAEADFTKAPPVLPLTPAEQAKHFILPAGYKIEPILSDPDIKEPTAIAFDGNGRMFVLEDRGYMQDADAGGERDPVGRISVHEDVDNDGVYEKHGVFVDKLVFPRFVTPFGANAILTMETDADEVWKYTDTNNDGVADKKELFATGFGRAGNVEHQQSFLTWTMDNWMYSTVNAFRARWTPAGIVREPTGSNGAQWGVTQDNDGKMWFQGGASGLPAYFQFPVVYGNFNVPDPFEKDFEIPWGAPVRIADMQGGMPSVRMPDGTLNRVTGAAGNDVFRGDRLPADAVGDYFYGEPVARIVRRVKPVVSEGLTQLRNAYRWNEFIKSTDPLFRPVDLTTAPDGTLYVTDMYRGIIQEAQWSGQGTYLRARINQYALDKVHSHGRIWRVTYDGMARDRTQPRMLSETPAQLVARLSHRNGWWRDTAQQLIVLRQDKSVVPALQQLTRTSPNLLARFHALWTLEGLGALDAALVRAQMKDASPRMRIQSIRASETLYKSGDRSFAEDYRALTKDPDANVAIQAIMTLNTLKVADAPAVIRATLEANKARGVQLVANAILNPSTNVGRGGMGGRGGPPPFTPDEQAVIQRGETIYKELCFSCHGDDGRGAPQPGGAGTTIAPPLAGSPRVQGHRDYVVKTLLHGMTGPVDEKLYAAGVMVPMGTNRDEWIADVSSYVRNSFGNYGAFVTAADVARVRRATDSRKTMWTLPELEASLPRLLTAQPDWKATASDNPARAASAFTFLGWSTGAPQQPGMWFQIELPAPVMLTELQFDSAGAGGRGGGRGAPAGRGAAPTDASAPAAGAAPPAAAPAAVPPGVPFGGPPNPAAAGFPRGYSVQVSLDGTTWSAPVADGRGTSTSTVIAFAPVNAKFVRITQTAAAEGAPPWSIQRLRLYQAGR